MACINALFFKIVNYKIAELVIADTSAKAYFAAKPCKAYCNVCR